MRKTALILITSLLLATGLQGQSRKRGRDATRDPAVNVGIKAGFNSSIILVISVTSAFIFGTCLRH